MNLSPIRTTIKLLCGGEYGIFLREAGFRLYKRIHDPVFFLVAYGCRRCPGPAISVQTSHPVAYESPDHLVPWGTKVDNSTNRRFVLSLNRRVRQSFPDATPALLDLGCSGGQLVADFLRLGWVAVGVEGSDYSLKHRRANWAHLAGRNLFTCDLTKPYRILAETTPLRFHLVTAWEVLEHIKTEDLPHLFSHLLDHMAVGGYFMASTSSCDDIQNGVQLHQTRWSNAEWKRWIAENIPALEPVDLGLTLYQHVRINEAAFLYYRKRA